MNSNTSISISTSISTSTSTSISIVSLNCCLFPYGIRATWNSALKEQRCSSNMIPRIINMADIAICQEVFSYSFMRNYWITKMHLHLYKLFSWISPDYTELQHTKPYHIISSGLWTLVNRQFAIVSQTFITFIHSGRLLFSYIHPIGFLHTIVSRNNKIIHIINVHMLTDEGTCFLDSESFDVFYNEELQQLILFISQLEKNSLWIIGGDFNVEPSYLTNKFDNVLNTIIYPNILYKFHPTVNTCNENISFNNHSSKYMKVDQFYSNMEINYARVMEEEDHISDHLPIIAIVNY